MTTFAGRFTPSSEAAHPVTMDGLLTHFRTFGLDNAHSGYKGKPETYKNYKNLRMDALVHVARSRFGEETYIQLLQAIGYGHFEDKARADWKDMRDGIQA